MIRAGASIVLVVTSCGEPPAREEARTIGLEDLRAIGYVGGDDTPPGFDVSWHDREAVWPGLNLTTDDGSTCFAIDMEGREVHRWVVPGHDQVEHFELLPGGRIVAVSVDQGVSLLEADSSVVWQIALPAHHDVRPTRRGGFLVPVHDEQEYAGRAVRFDAVVELDADGREAWRWEARDHLAALQALHGPHLLDEPPPEPGDETYDYHHLNTALEAPVGSPWGDALLVCLRNVDLLVAIDRESGVPVWSFGPGALDFPHDPSLTSSGTVLVFDNGYHRGRSRLVEIDPETKEIVWEWSTDDFFTPIRGACQRLPGGSTLVTESERGRVLEVARGGAVVWELRTASGRRVYRMRRVPLEALAR